MNEPGYSIYFLNPAESKFFPLNWDEIFGRPAPLFLEIGCGNGEFIADWATRHPDWNCLGIELSLGSTSRMLKRIAGQRLKNVRLMMNDARFAVRELFSDNQLDLVMMNFPDPWPKEKHKKRRVIVPDFVASLSGVLKPGGLFELVTDQQWYAEQSADFFRDDGSFAVAPLEKNPCREVTTKYERKWLSENRETFKLQAKKDTGKSVHRLLEDSTMPHRIISKMPTEAEVWKLAGLVQKQKDAVFKIKEIYSGKAGGSYLLRTVTADRDFTQNFFILIAPHKNGSIVKIDGAFQPFRTLAVKMAVEEIGRMLASPKPPA